MRRVLIAVLAWGALSFGGVYPWAYWPLAVACAGLGVYGIVTTQAWHNHRLRNLAIAFATIAVAIALQWIELPHPMVAWLSPNLDSFFQQYALAYRPRPLQSLSIEPESTLVALGLLVAFGTCLVGLTGSIRYISFDWLMTRVMSLGALMSIVGVVQKALIDPVHPLVYGFWAPREGGNPFGPFINRNHFAGWMVMALPLVAGYSCAVLARTWHPVQGWGARVRWLTTVEASQFVITAFCALLMGMALALTGSRSGLASFAIAMMTFGYLAARHFKDPRARLLVVVYLVVILGGAVAWAGTDMALDRFTTARSDSPGRLLAWRDAVQIVRDFPAFGTGLGTFGKAMLVYQTADRPVMYDEAHNDYLQLLAEGGALVAVPSLVALGLVVVSIRRRLTAGQDEPLAFWVRTGAIAGLVGIAAQSTIEFSLQLPGNTALFVTLLAIAMHRPRSGQRRSSSVRVRVHECPRRQHALRV
jgi:O-antigen ligase